MEQHAVPRQITSFEFKLIGFFTIKQFVYLLLFAGFAVLFYFLLLPIKPFNFVIAGLVMAFGAFFALFRYNERELDVWIKNLLSSLLAPSQYYYMKHNVAPDFLKGIYVSGDDNLTLTHIDAQQKLAKYMDSKKTGIVEPPGKTQQIQTLLQQPQVAVAQPATPTPPETAPNKVANTTQAQSPTSSPTTTAAEPSAAAKAKPEASMSGVVHNNRNEPLPNIMVYINSEAGQVVRILKTNHHGLFATFHPLPPGDYSINPKDLGGKYFFDTMNITVDEQQLSPLQIYSKEVL
jgi:hypothetical protein